MLIFILTLVVLLAAYPTVLAPPPTQTPTITQTRTITPTVTLTPTNAVPTRTRRPTFTPTATLTPSLTPKPSQTITPMGPPSLTPARPLVGSSNYSLQPWSPEKADQVIALLNDYPNTLPNQARGENDENYYAAFIHAALAQNEALLRFPDAPQADAWRWGLAYNLARLSDPQAGKYYADLIARSLNQGESDLANLAKWFGDREPNFKLTATEIKPLPGFLSTYLIQIDGPGSAVFLLLETPAGYQMLPLVSAFDFVNRNQLQAFASDLTGDGIEEAVIYANDAPDDLNLSAPYVFDLSELPPKQLSFNPATASFPVGTEFSQNWSANPQGDAPALLQFNTQLFPFCPVSFSRTYLWTGERFDAEPPEFQFNPVPVSLGYCELVEEHAFRVWGADQAIQISEKLLPIWPPKVDADGNPSPPDAMDKLRFHLGMYYALTGSYDKALLYMNDVIENPAVPHGDWSSSARKFLDDYHSPEDIYRACVNQDACDAGKALKYLVGSLPPDQYANALKYLWDSGVNQRASGYYDFDGDGTKESWFTVRHRPGEKLEFWVLAVYPQGIKAIYVDTVESNLPAIIPYNEEAAPILILDGNTSFLIKRVPGSLEPYITYPNLPQFYPNRFEDALDSIMFDFFNGDAPADIQARLLELQDYPGLLCEATWSCDRYYYLLALASELAGDNNMALETYLQLWWDYSKSPYTTMARLRLKGPSITATVSPTITSTLSSTATPTVTGTPPTATPTTDPNATPTETPSPTVSATPYPYP